MFLLKKIFIHKANILQTSFNVINRIQFLRNKADVNFVNEHGNTALHYACFGNYPAIAEDLVEFGGLVNIENKYPHSLRKPNFNSIWRLSPD